MNNNNRKKIITPTSSDNNTDIFIRQEELYQHQIKQLNESYIKTINSLKEENRYLKQSNDLLIKKINELVSRLSDLT
jgi:lipoate-protein ligase A